MTSGGPLDRQIPDSRFRTSEDFLIISGLTRRFAIINALCNGLAIREVCVDIRNFQLAYLNNFRRSAFVFQFRLRLQILFGIPSELYGIPIGVGPLDCYRLAWLQSCHRKRGLSLLQMSRVQLLNQKCHTLSHTSP